MRLAVILTGGTIGSKKEQGWIAPNQEEPWLILEEYKHHYPELAADIVFDVKVPYQILSENLNGAYLNRLIQEVGDAVGQAIYDGILICHGTDTLAYTAAMLAWVLQGVKIPVLLISSNYPLQDVRANGLANFRFGVETVRQGLQGVYVVYQNRNRRTYVHAGRKILTHQTFEDEIYSLHGEYAGVYDEDGQFNRMKQKECGQSCLPTGGYHGLRESSEFIQWIRLYPGVVYPSLNGMVKAVLLESYHSGTIAVGPLLNQFMQQAKERQIPVYLVGAVRQDGGYETMKEYQSLGIRVLENMAPIAVYCYLWMIFS